MSTETEKIRRGTHREGVTTSPSKLNGKESKPNERDLALQALGALKFATLSDVNRAQITPKQPLVQDLLYPGAYLLVGRPKVGKSWLLLQLALALAEGTDLLGFKVRTPAEVLAIFGEDDDSRIKGRLQALGCANAPDNCHVVNQQKLFALARQYARTVSFQDFLEVWLDQHPGVRLVLVDTEATVRQVWEGEAGTASDDTRVIETDYKQTRGFDEIALRRQIVIVLVNHAAKRKGEWVDIHELINRSNTALAGCSGSMVLADPPDADPLDPSKTRIFGVRARDLRDDILLAVQQREEMPYFFSLGPYIEVKQTETEQLILETVEELMEESEDKQQYITSKAIAETNGMQQGTVKRALNRMKKADRMTWKQYRVTLKSGRKGGVRLDR